MRAALCYSGQIGAFYKAIQSQKNSFLSECDDIYAYTSNVVSHKTLNQPQLPPSSDVHEYLKANIGWRKNQTSYGVVYKVDNSLVEQILSAINTKKQYIEDESLEDTLNDSDLTKWQWLRKRQLWKMYQCNQMVDEDYDIVVRCRFEFNPFVKIPIKNIYKEHGSENRVFLFGGWKCVQPMVFMDEFICDGFAFGSPKAMNIFSSLYLQEDAYPFDPKYKDCWDKYGDNVEYQLKKHLEKHDIELVYIGNKRNMYHLQR